MTTGFAPHAPAFASMEQADEQFSFAPQIDLQDHKDSEGVLSNGRWSLDDKFDALGNMIVAHAAGAPAARTLNGLPSPTQAIHRRDVISAALRPGRLFDRTLNIRVVGSSFSNETDQSAHSRHHPTN